MLRRAVATSLSLLLVVAIATPAAATLWCRAMGRPMTTCCCGHDEDAPASGATIARACCERTAAASALPTIEMRSASEFAAPTLYVMPSTAPAIGAEAWAGEATRTAALEPRPPPAPERAQLATWIL